MKSIASLAAILIGQDWFEEVARRTREGRTPLRADQWISYALIFSIFVTVLLIAAWVMQRRDRRRIVNSPKKLFWGLCHAHGLGWADRWILWSIVRQKKTADPAMLFLDPDLLDSAQRDPTWRDHSARLGKLWDRLFGGISAPEPVLTSPLSNGDLLSDAPVKKSTSAAPPPVVSPSLDLPPWSNNSPAST